MKLRLARKVLWATYGHRYGTFVRAYRRVRKSRLRAQARAEGLHAPASEA